MKFIAFHLKKAFRSPVLWVFLLALLILPGAFYHLGEESTPRPAAFYAEDPSDENVARMSAYLQDAGFLPYDDPQQMREDVENESLDAALLIPKDLTTRLQTGDCQEILVFYQNTGSLYPDLWRGHAITALFSVYAPYISSDILEQEGLLPEDMHTSYWSKMEQGRLFRFRFTQQDGAPLPESNRSLRLYLFAVSCLLFPTCCFGIAFPMAQQQRLMAKRLEKETSLRTLYLPGLAVRSVLLFTILLLAPLGAGLRPEGGLLLSMPLTLLAAVVLSWIPEENLRTVVVLFISLFSMALMPVYVDMALLFPLADKLRWLLPPCLPWLLTSLL